MIGMSSSAAEIPVGTIIPFAGDCSEGSTLEALIMAGWFPCDGSNLTVADFPDLYAAIGTCHGAKVVGKAVVSFNVPDLNSLFARGVDITANVDPDKGSRTAPKPGANTGNEVGSFQGYATSAPHSPFTTDLQGSHSHTVGPVTTSYNHAWGGGPHEMAHVNGRGQSTAQIGGAHTHAITGGGDPETRPVNLCLSWIIRTQNISQGAEHV